MPRKYSTGARDKNEARLLEHARAYFGMLDVLYLREGQGADLILTAWGQTFYVEVKNGRKKKLTPVEADRQTNVRLADGKYWVWRTDSDVSETMEYYRDYSPAAVLIDVGRERAFYDR